MKNGEQVEYGDLPGMVIKQSLPHSVVKAEQDRLYKEKGGDYRDYHDEAVINMTKKFEGRKEEIQGMKSGEVEKEEYC
jgi:hypothetical protein